MSLFYRSKSKSSPRRPVRLEFEALEERMLLASNIISGATNISGTLDAYGPSPTHFRYEDGSLFIRADHRNNVMEIRQGATLDEFVIFLPVTGQSTVFNGVTGDLDIDLGDGDDSLRLIGLTVPGDLRVASNFRMENVVVMGDAELATNGLLGNYTFFPRDFAEIQNSHFLGSLTLETGAADVTINQSDAD